MDVQVAALGEPKSVAASAARNAWTGDVMSLDGAVPAPLLIDALFGTGLSRGLDAEVAGALNRLAAAAGVRVAIDLPSGVSTDDGRILSPVPDYDLTVTFATLKPAHRLQPAARHMGRIVIGDIGIVAHSRLAEIGRPKIARPGPDDHKYRRGYVAAVAGEMPGAIGLTVSAAARAGAGYVRLVGPAAPELPHAVVQSGPGLAAIEDRRIGAVAIGPGLGRGAEARQRLKTTMAQGHPLVVDADGLVLLAEIGLATIGKLPHIPILTPHAGEFERLFGREVGSKVDRTRRAAAAAAAIIVYKGPDTVIAAPDGRAAIASASSWLATAGTGDVLTGCISAMRAKGLDAFEAACAGIWLHGRAAVLAGPGLIADDLIACLTRALAECSE